MITETIFREPLHACPRALGAMGGQHQCARRLPPWCGGSALLDRGAGGMATDFARLGIALVAGGGLVATGENGNQPRFITSTGGYEKIEGENLRPAAGAQPIERQRRDA